MKRILALVAVLAVPVVAAADILQQVIVKINGDIITKTELERRQVLALRQRNLDVNVSDAAMRQALSEITPELIASYVDEILIVQHGRERGWALGDEQFTEVLERIKTENEIETEEQLQSALAQEGMTMDDLRQALERQMLVSRVQQVEVMGKIGVTDAELRIYYDAHPEEFSTTATVTLRELLVSAPMTEQEGPGGRMQPSINVGADEAARERVEALRERAIAGEDFATLIAAESEAASRANGGLIGPLSRSEMDEGLLETLDGLDIGEVSEPVRTNRGYHLFMVEARTTPEVEPFENVRDQVRQRLFDSKRDVEFEKFMNGLRDQAIIEWRNDELRRAYETYRSAQTPPAPPTQ